MKKKGGAKASDGLSLKSYAAAIEECSAIGDAIAVMERLLVAIRAAPEPRDLSGNLGHFSDWLYEACRRDGTFTEPTLASALATLDALSEASSKPPSPSDLARIRENLADAYAGG
jgi:hypothetical protein